MEGRERDATGSGAALRRQEEEFSRLLQVSQLVVMELDLAKVFELVAANARAIVDAELVIVPMLNEGRDQYTYVAASGAGADAVRGTSFGKNVGMCGWVLQHERSLLFGENSRHWIEEKPAWEAGQESAVLVPLVGRKGIIGGLSALGKQGGGCFTRHDLELLTMFANQVSGAIENARLFQQLTREIEERTQAEESLRRNEQFIRGVLDTVDEGFIVVDRDYRIVTVNNAYSALAGRSCEGVIGRPCFEVSHRHSRPCWEEGEECAVRQVFATGEPHAVSHRHTDAAGTVVFVETKAYPMKDRAGTVVSAIETVINITERHLLAEERLKTQKLESIGTLAGGIAHDFNNLLQGIFGYISMAKHSADQKEKVLAMLGQSENALHMAVNLTTQLLTFSKGGKPVRRLSDLRSVIENATRFTLSGSRSDFRLDVPEDLWQVEADTGQVAQAIQNIVLNADQAMPTGGSVVVTAKNLAAGDASLPRSLPRGRYVLISIRDSGIGIPERNLGKIFDPYFTTKDKGSGLGLATSYSIVRNHGGLIDVRTLPSEGSTFMVYLPATSGAVPAAPEAAPRTPLPTRKVRVLVMDDEEIIRALSGELLAVLGNEVEVARHGQEALDLYRGARTAGKPFDVVILDLTVRGGMGGVEAMQRLLEIDPSVRAVVSSGYSDDASMADHLSHGFKAFLKKPYNIVELQDTLARVLAQEPRGG